MLGIYDTIKVDGGNRYSRFRRLDNENLSSSDGDRLPL